VLEDECDISFLFLRMMIARLVRRPILLAPALIFLLAIDDWFCRSADTAFAESSGNMDLPRGISSIPTPLAVFFNLTIYLHVYTDMLTVYEGSLQVEVVTIDLSTMSNATVTAN